MQPMKSTLLLLTLIGAGNATPAAAENPLGFYLGGAFGESQISIASDGLVPSSVDLFTQNNLGYEFMAGVRPLPWIGAELAYVNLGHPDGNLAGAPANADIQGGSAFGVVYLPLPGFELFAKAGAARLQTSVNGRTYSTCVALDLPCPSTYPFQVDRTNTTFATGAGGQLRFGQLAVRLQYEYFPIPSEHTGMFSLGLNWTF
jgi:opacity protein-like surface antigen